MAVCNGTSSSRKMEISGPLPSYAQASSDNALTSLLPKQDGNTGVTPAAVSLDNGIVSGKSSNFQNNLIGHFKGFSITSLPSPAPSTTASKLSSPPSKMANAVSPPTVPSGTMKPPRPPSILTKPHNSSVSRNASTVGCIVSSASTSVSAEPPTVTFAPLPRPVISSPVLDTTTCTAKELTNSVRPVPSRPAPQVPNTTATTTQKPVRPLSSPNTLSVNPIVDEKKSKDGGQTYPTLTRLASFMLRQNSDGDKHKDKMKGKLGDGTNSLPRKANKLQIDREALRNLKISNPIPQQEIEIPENAVPVKPEVDNKQVVMRAQSMRDTSHVGQRPVIPTFGSMRQPSGTKRPTSIPTGTRPSSPPPPRPPLQPGMVETGIIGLPGYQNPPAVASPTDYGYDDCFNLLAGGSAPLANIDEESSPTNGGGNIYAVIEESPPECGRKNVLRDEVQSRCSPSLPVKNSVGTAVSKSQYSSPMLGDYKTPKPLDNSTSAGSIDSMGLLSEIVNEIQARNFESIYSSSNDKRTKSDDEDGNSSVVATDHSVAGSSSPPLYGYKSGNDASSISSAGTYINAPYSSSNIYGGGSSLYSNVSMQNNPASSPPPNTKSNFSSSSSSSGYLSPTPPLSSISNAVQPNSIISAAKPSSTFKNSQPTTSGNSDKSAREEKSSAPANLPQNLSSYKPYASSFHRPLGPLAAASFKSSASSTPVNDKTASSQVSAKPKVTPGSMSQSNMPLVNAEEQKPQSVLPSLKAAVPTPNKSSLHQPAAANTPSGPPKPAGTALKPAPSVPVGGGRVSKTETKLSNSPDVVSSCSPGTAGDASRSPDVIGGKASLKVAPKSPDIASKQQVNAPAAGVGRSTSSVTAAASKLSASSMASKPTTTNSSFRSKQPQTAPKPNISKPSVVSDKTRAPTSMAKGKGVPGVAKSVSDVGANRTIPAGARAAASKLSHVASLQQKFETAGNSSDKSVPTVSRTVSGVGAKTKVPSTAGKTGLPYLKDLRRLNVSSVLVCRAVLVLSRVLYKGAWHSADWLTISQGSASSECVEDFLLPLLLHLDAAPYVPCFTLINSQDLVKGRQYLYTSLHSWNGGNDNLQRTLPMGPTVQPTSPPPPPPAVKPKIS
ncbi:hypothetical protein PR048_029827 [Dryococelus australis]|uniref:Uncharacterized protein n=1 Tax=Dryococelus australis TaxID=614101 RepID=A0ABQ9G784_9NEOP|nr:hypothetical protein PR048_029827 [Dryococelus australis]